ncbi:MAG: SURF1 family protein [Ilumatobacteraceae bacterium]
MYRFLFRPRWIAFHLLVVGGIVLMVNLGFWQLDRLEQRRDFNERVVARTDLPVERIGELLGEANDAGDPDPDDPAVRDLAWRRVVATGTYRPDEQFLVVNRSQNGRAGVNVATPMTLPDGRALIVNRGFVPLDINPPAPPGGEVNVQGIVRPSQERRTGQLSDPADGTLTEVQRIDIERLEDQIAGSVLPVYVDLLESRPAEQPGLPEPVVQPDLSDGPHLSYAVQWFIFAASVVVGWVLAVRYSVTKRRRDAAAPADPPPPGDDEPATELARTPDA